MQVEVSGIEFSVIIGTQVEIKSRAYFLRGVRAVIYLVVDIVITTGQDINSQGRECFRELLIIMIDDIADKAAFLKIKPYRVEGYGSFRQDACGGLMIHFKPGAWFESPDQFGKRQMFAAIIPEDTWGGGNNIIPGYKAGFGVIIFCDKRLCPPEFPLIIYIKILCEPGESLLTRGTGGGMRQHGIELMRFA